MNHFSKKQLNLINISLDIILKEGIQSLTIKNLSTRAGVTEPAIYRHFKSKFDILYNLLDFFEKHSEIFLENINKNQSVGLEKLKIFFLTHCKRFNDNKAFAIIMFSEEIFINNKELESKLFQIIKKQKKVLISIIHESQKNNLIISDIPEEHIFTLIIGSLRFLVSQWKMTKFKNNLKNMGEEYWISLENLIKIKSENKSI